MSYGRYPYGGVAYAGSDVAQIPQADTDAILAVEVAFTTGALAEPAWVDITPDVRWWDVSRGRQRELERFQPGRATVVLSNLSRQYDSVHATGPWFGNIKPMRRIRIRETFNGVTYPVFDGFIDRWQLDYPGVGKDATATVTATDAFKVFARTALPRSVYTLAAGGDAPTLWWRLDEPQNLIDATLSTVNSGSLGAASNGTVAAAARQQFGRDSLIVHDAGASLELNEQAQQNISGPAVVDYVTPWAIECWIRLTKTPTAGPPVNLIWEINAGGTPFVNLTLQLATMKLRALTVPNGGGGGTQVDSTTVLTPLRRYHVVVTHDTDRLLRIYVDGVLEATSAATTGTLTVTTFYLGSVAGAISPPAFIDEVAIYRAAGAASATNIAARNAAGTLPWNGDLPGARIGRVLDIAQWPSSLRELDAGDVTLQSAALDVDALEHTQKTGETEFGLLFVSRDGKARFIGKDALFARAPYPTVFGDTTGEIGYRAFVPDDGDEVIRNRATISRLNGSAQTDQDAASITAYGRFDYVLDGLLHSSDSYSATYAAFIVDEYAAPRRRITSLSLGPSIVGDEDIVYPAMLGLELGDAITVRSRPVGGGATFEQVCAVEGLHHTGTPGGDRQATVTLSPDFTGSF